MIGKLKILTEITRACRGSIRSELEMPSRLMNIFKITGKGRCTRGSFCGRVQREDARRSAEEKIFQGEEHFILPE